MTVGGALVLAYCQLHILELMCQGHGRNDAVHAAYRLYSKHLVLLAPTSAWQLFRDGLTARYWCLALAAADTADALGGVPGLEGISWLLETVRRVAHGGELLASARGAHDAHLGRPRRRRRPVEADWLTGEVTTALDAVWAAICQPGVVTVPPGWGTWLADHPQRPVAST